MVRFTVLLVQSFWKNAGSLEDVQPGTQNSRRVTGFPRDLSYTPSGPCGGEDRMANPNYLHPATGGVSRSRPNTAPGRLHFPASAPEFTVTR